ncbi:hypothetical protein RB195_017027 [Necator americanus]|uniref:Mariner Mos1 transposase n=1 Tax=Necator americanus TaxID=51031 RepID=A0ABR1C391_NECAM
MEALLDQDSSQTEEEPPETVGMTRQAISSRLKAMVQKCGSWIPYEFNPGDVEHRFFTCEQLLQEQYRNSFLHLVMTRDEKWIHYDNPKLRKSWGQSGRASASAPKPNIKGVTPRI